MALIREAEEWVDGEVSSGGTAGYPGPVGSRGAGGAEGSLSEVLGICRTQEEVYSGKTGTLGTQYV